jgi:Pyridine nucleotide-disulphide oxidoreductase
LAKSEVKYLSGWAKFVDAHTIEVNGEKVTGKYMLIAVGGEPRMPDIPGKEFALNSDDFFKIEDLPKTVAISGAGYIAVELAGILNALGSKVGWWCVCVCVCVWVGGGCAGVCVCVWMYLPLELSVGPVSFCVLLCIDAYLSVDACLCICFAVCVCILYLWLWLCFSLSLSLSLSLC